MLIPCLGLYIFELVTAQYKIAIGNNIITSLSYIISYKWYNVSPNKLILYLISALFELAYSTWKSITIVINVAGYIDEFDHGKCIDINLVSLNYNNIYKVQGHIYGGPQMTSTLVQMLIYACSEDIYAISENIYAITLQIFM